MTMQFGKKARDLKSMRSDLKQRKTRGGITYIGEDGLEIRFLTEPEEWTRYTEAYSPSMRKAWPVPEGAEPEVEDARKSVRYAAVAIDLKNDKVIVVKLPVTLVDQLSARAEKRGTLTNIDIELYRSGEGLDTVYGYDPGEKSDRPVDKYELPDVNSLLAAEYNNIWGEDEEEVEPPAKTKASRRTAVFEDDDEDEDDVDDDPEDDDTDDSDDSSDDDDDEDEDEDEDDEESEVDDDFFTAEELEDMSIAELRSIAKANGIETRGMKKDDLIASLV